MGRFLILTALALLLALASAQNNGDADCDSCAAEFVDIGGCEVLASGGELPLVIPDTCRGNCWWEITKRCSPPCPDNGVRDCDDPSYCWPASYKTDAIMDCGYSNKNYFADLSCHDDIGHTECPAPKGCDGVAGSGLVEDECGVCDGNGMSCSCLGGSCEVLLSIAPDPEDQTKATVNHCSSDHWRGYQFTVKGAKLVAWESAIHELVTQCNPDTGICVGFGYSERTSLKYSAHHIAKNKHDPATDASMACNSPLARLEFEPESAGSVHLEDVLIASDYDYLAGGTRGVAAAVARPNIELFWRLVGIEYAFLWVASDSTVDKMTITIKFGAGILDAQVDNSFPPPASFECGQFDGTSNEMVCVFESGASLTDEGSNNGGDISPGYKGPSTFFQVNVDESNVAEATVEIVVGETTTFPPSEVDFSVVVPEVVHFPSVIVDFRTTSLTSGVVTIRAIEEVRGCQFKIRGVDIETSAPIPGSPFGQLHSKKFPGEEKFILFDMAGGFVPGDAQEVEVMEITFAHQTLEQANVQIGDIRCADNSGSGSTGASAMPVAFSGSGTKIDRCDTRHEGLCDHEDFDNDGCTNEDDFAPRDELAGCGACGDVSADGEVDILDIVMAVQHIKSDEYNTVVDVDTNEAMDNSDVDMIRFYATHPVPDHPSLPNCFVP